MLAKKKNSVARKRVVPMLKQKVKKKLVKKKNKPNAESALSAVRRVNDPTTLLVPPTLSMQAGCYPMNQTIRADFDQTQNYAAMLFITTCGGTGSVGCMVTWDAVGAGAITRTVHTLPLLAAAGSAGGASSSKASKVGVRLVNVSPNLYVSGKVYVASLNQRLNLPALASVMTNAQWNSVFNEVKALPEHMLHTFSAAEFTPSGRCYGKCIPCHVVDEVDYNNYFPHEGAITVDEYFSIFTQTSIATTANSNRPLSTTVILIDKQSLTGTTFLQQYVYNIDAQFLTRWPLNTVPGVSSKDVLPSHPEAVSVARADALGAHARL